MLEGEQEVELDEEEQRELEQKYARRQLGSNADRYVEPEPQLDSDGAHIICMSALKHRMYGLQHCTTGEEVVEPEFDLSAFLERQRLSPSPSSAPPPPDEDEEVDVNLAQILAQGKPAATSKKGRVQTIEWDAGLEEMLREKAAAEATRGEIHVR